MDRPAAVPVSAESLARLLALYQAGYRPESAGLHEQTAALGWHGCARLDRLFARWPLSVIALPDGTRLAWPDIEARVAWEHVRATYIDGLVVAPRRNRLAWWTGHPV